MRDPWSGNWRPGLRHRHRVSAYQNLDQEKDQGYDVLMRRAADHRIYDRISRWRTASYPEVTTVAVVRKLLPVADRTHMAKTLGMSLGDLENQLTLALPKGVRDHARTLSCRLPRWQRL